MAGTTDTISSTEMLSIMNINGNKQYTTAEKRILRNELSAMIDKNILIKVCQIIIENGNRVNADNTSTTVDLMALPDKTLEQIDKLLARYKEKKRERENRRSIEWNIMQ